MNKLTTIATALLAAAVITGCASSGSSKPESGKAQKTESKKTDGVQAEFQKWASKRAPVEQVVSKCADPEVAAIVNGVAVIPGEVYGYLANGADKAMANNAGREIWNAVQRDVAAGTSWADISAAMSPADKAAYAEFDKFVKAQDYATLGQKLAGIASKLATDGAKVGGAITAIQNLDSMKGKSKIALAMAMREPTAEVNAIKDQVADATKACNYWIDLNRQDEMAQKFLKDYPIEK